MMRPAALACLFAALLLPLVVAAKTLRWSSQGDVSTMDPHSFNEALNNNISLLIYEPLVYRDKQFKIDPELAIAWSQPSPTLWRFELRPGVRFHDGTPFTAEDVVFSIERAQAPNSGYKAETAGIAGVRKTGELTVEITTAGPNPVLLHQLTHHEQGVGGEARRDEAAKLQGQGGDVRRSQHQWHGAVYAQGARGGR